MRDKKKAPKISPNPNSIPFVSVLQKKKKTFNNFCRKGHALIVKGKIGLEYVLPNLDNLVFGL